MNKLYCVYLTTYFGSKLPMYYVGSTSIKNINSGYRGSVSSKLYKTIWLSELKNNPHLFKTSIISTHESRLDATNKENKIHTQLNCVKSSMYINMWYAIPNGFSGYDSSGSNNPMYGKSRVDARLRMTTNNPMKSPESISKMVATRKLMNIIPHNAKIKSYEDELYWFTKFNSLCTSSMSRQKIENYINCPFRLDTYIPYWKSGVTKFKSHAA